MNAVECLLQQFDTNLQHKWESLESILKGVTDEEARWQAPCYATEEREANCPPPGTIFWQLDHISGCNRGYAKLLLHRPATKYPESAPMPLPETIAAALEELRASHAALRAEVAKLTDAHLNDACGHGGSNVFDFLAACLRHEIWHAGQIAVIRRLYRTRN